MIKLANAGLQDYRATSMAGGIAACRKIRISKPDKDYIGDQITLFTDRCIMCTRLRTVHA